MTIRRQNAKSPARRPGRAGARPARSAARRRGSVLIIVIGLLAVVAVLAAAYISVGRADRRTAAAVTSLRAADVPERTLTEYILGIVGRDRLDVTYEVGDLEGRAVAVREATDYPYVDGTVLSSADPSLAAIPPAYGAILPQHRPLLTFTPQGGPSQMPQNGGFGAIINPLTPTLRASLAERGIFRTFSDPWLAAGTPTFEGNADPNLWETPEGRFFSAKAFDGSMPTLIPNAANVASAVAEPARLFFWLDNRDWRSITNIAPSGNFVNLWNMRPEARKGGFDTPSGVGNLGSAPARAVGAGAGARPGNMSDNLTLITLDPSGLLRPTLQLPPHLYGTGQFAHPNVPQHWSMFQRYAYFPLNQPFPTLHDSSVFDGFSGGVRFVTPADPDYLPYQWADTDGDGFADARWFELVDVNEFTSLLPAGDYRFFAAARIIDLSGRVDVNVATDAIAGGTGQAPWGLTPAEIDLRSILTMRRFTMEHNSDDLLNAGVPAVSAAPWHADRGLAFLAPADLVMPPSEVARWENARTEGAKMLVGDLPLSDPANYGGYVEVPPTFGSIEATGGIAYLAGTHGYDALMVARNLTGPLDLWLSKDLFLGPDLWKTAAEPGGNERTPDGARHPRWMLPVGRDDPGLRSRAALDRLRLFTESSAFRPSDFVGMAWGATFPSYFTGNYYFPQMNLFGIADLAELLTFDGINDDRVVSRLERVVDGRANLLPGATGPDAFMGGQVGPLMSNRPTALERFSGDRMNFAAYGGETVFPAPDGIIDAPALATLHLSPRRLLTTISGAAELRSTPFSLVDYATGNQANLGRLPQLADSGSTFADILTSDGKINLPELLWDIRTNSNGRTPNDLFRLFARALVPYADLVADVRTGAFTFNDVHAVWSYGFSGTSYDGGDNAYWTLNYGHLPADFGVRTAATLAVNLIDSYDEDDEPTVATVLLAREDGTPGAPELRLPVESIAANRDGEAPFSAYLGPAGRRFNLGNDRLPSERQIDPNDDLAGAARVRAVNVIGIEKHPVLVSAATVVGYVDFPGDPTSVGGVAQTLEVSSWGDNEWDLGSNGEIVETKHPTIDTDPNWIANSDLLIQALVFQIANPYDEPITLGGYYGGAPGGANGWKTLASDDEPIDFNYYIEFGGRYYALAQFADTAEYEIEAVKLRPDGDTSGLPASGDEVLSYRPVTLAPGESRTFYVIPHDTVETVAARLTDAMRYHNAGGVIEPMQVQLWLQTQFGQMTSATNFDSAVRIRPFSPRTGQLLWADARGDALGVSVSGSRLSNADNGTPASGPSREDFFAIFPTGTVPRGSFNPATDPLRISEVLHGFRKPIQDQDFREVRLWRRITLTEAGEIHEAASGGPISNGITNDLLADRLAEPSTGVHGRRGTLDGDLPSGGHDMDVVFDELSEGVQTPNELPYEDPNSTTVPPKVWRNGPNTSMTVIRWTSLRRPGQAAIGVQPWETRDDPRIAPRGVVPAWMIENPEANERRPSGVLDPSDFHLSVHHASVLFYDKFLDVGGTNGFANEFLDASMAYDAGDEIVRVSMRFPRVDRSLYAIDHWHQAPNSASAPASAEYGDRLVKLTLDQSRFRTLQAAGASLANKTHSWNRMRLADVLLTLAVGPVHSPTIGGALPTSFDETEDFPGAVIEPGEWITLGEQLAAVFDQWNPTDTETAFPAWTRALGENLSTPVLEPLLDGGRLRLDAFAPFLDVDAVTVFGGNPNNDALLKPRLFNPAYDIRRHPGIPLGLNILNLITVIGPEEQGDMLTGAVVGRVNLNTAGLGVLRSIPGLTPSLYLYETSSGLAPEWWGAFGASAGSSVMFDPFNTSSDGFRHRPDIAATLLAYRDRKLADETRLASVDPSLTPLTDRFADFSAAYDISGGPDYLEVAGRNFDSLGFGSSGGVTPEEAARVQGQRSFDATAISLGGFLSQSPSDLWNLSLPEAQTSGIHGLRPQPGFASVAEALAVSIASDSWRGEHVRQNTFAAAADLADGEYVAGRGPVGGLTVSGNGPEQVTPLSQLVGVGTAKQPDAIAGDYEEKLALANAMLNSVTVRSDVFAAWYVIHGYTRSDVEEIGADEPLDASFKKRYLMIIDRSNVTKVGDQPRILLMTEVPY